MKRSDVKETITRAELINLDTILVSIGKIIAIRCVADGWPLTAISYHDSRTFVSPLQGFMVGVLHDTQGVALG